MDIGSTIVGLILIILGVAPFYFLIRGKKLREKETINDLKSLAETEKCQITTYDLWKTSAIGLDQSANVLFFTRKVRDQRASIRVNLSDILKSRVVNINRKVKNKDGHYTVVEQLALEFTFIDNKVPAVRLEFFNANTEMWVISNELQLVNKWSKIVSERLMPRAA